MDANELKAAQENLKKKSQAKKAQNSKVADLLTAGKRIGSKPIKHEIGGFEFETVSVIPNDVREKFTKVVVEMQKNPESVINVIDGAAELMANICIDEELKDPQVWLDFNDESGALVDVIQHLLSELVISHEEMKTFR